ncbi:hypothetical protein GUITHDRAFT_143280 [Guillardia theta CCMP2712]|uniref:Uncharacterized protein n=1 Tax=Guillardia theta (strain CCMP2712) TaxID=905079 RepID=L1IV31_GUITC|nr:hypothetical protein GUITHDRAFT_143280 [Guillardia theta CCMP2712]EKX39690.1 hypothetical protein GUITHDRAFT_143280 [Guillardia theta CCMP2712]|eukprot:XP_005826670.1 hypothetical protein GUITHDRAFT_143280 [Guillardia theta CCMP2712]
MAAVTAVVKQQQDVKEGGEEERLWLLLGLGTEGEWEDIQNRQSEDETIDESRTKAEQLNADPLLDLASKHASLGNKLEGGMFSHNVDSLQRCLQSISAHAIGGEISLFLYLPASTRLIVMLSDGFVHDRVSDFEGELAEKENIMSERLNNVQQNDNCQRAKQGSDSETACEEDIQKLTTVMEELRHSVNNFNDIYNSQVKSLLQRLQRPTVRQELGDAVSRTACLSSKSRQFIQDLKELRNLLQVMRSLRISTEVWRLCNVCFKNFKDEFRTGHSK